MSSTNSSDVLAHVGANLRRLRRQAEVSQESLAEASGVSRRTIINLEAGGSNIGLATLDQLAHALGVTFVDLVTDPNRPSADTHEVAWRGQHPDSVATLLGAAPASCRAELWVWSLGPGDSYTAAPDPDGWHEIVLVTEGRLGIRRDDGTVDLAPGEHSIYSSAQHYTYSNLADKTTRFARIVVR
jgi:transcriptional regulator with XRE-family HTH domain